MKMSQIVLTVLLAGAFAASWSFGQTPPESVYEVEAISTSVPAETQPADVQPAGEIDDWAPGLGLFALAMFIIIFVVFAVLMGLGIVLGLFLLALVAFLAVLGVVSSSAAVGLATRSPGKAIKVLLIQLGALAGACCGIAIAWILNLMFHTGWSGIWILVAGALGLLTGAAVAITFCYVCGAVGKWAAGRSKQAGPAAT